MYYVGGGGVCVWCMMWFSQSEILISSNCSDLWFFSEFEMFYFVWNILLKLDLYIWNEFYVYCLFFSFSRMLQINYPRQSEHIAVTISWWAVLLLFFFFLHFRALILRFI